MDYDPAGNDLYFEYDYLEKLGEYKQQLISHGWTWVQHYEPVFPTKYWLTFVGRFGDYWAESCAPFSSGTPTFSPLSPIYGNNHEWLNFTENYSQYGFGNPLPSSPFVNFAIVFVADPSIGD